MYKHKKIQNSCITFSNVFFEGMYSRITILPESLPITTKSVEKINLSIKCAYERNESFPNHCTYNRKPASSKNLLKWSVFHCSNIKNTRSESDLHKDCKPKKSQTKIRGLNGIWTHDLCDTSAMLRYQFQLSYETSWKQVKCEFNLYLLYEENDMICIW